MSRRSNAARLLGLLALAIVHLLTPRTGAAKPAVVTSSEIPVFREALTGVLDEFGDSLDVHDLARSSAGEVRDGLAADRPELIIAIGAAALRLAAEARPKTPIVFLLVADPEVVASARGGRALHGVGLDVAPEAILELLEQLVPKVRHVWTVYTKRGTGGVVDGFRSAAAAAGYSLTATAATDAASALRALRSPPNRVDAFLMMADPRIRNSAADEVLLRLAFGRGFPVVGVSRADVRAGALFALQLDAAAIGRQGAALARDLLAGTDARSPVIVAPASYRLVLNLATARQLRIKIPDAVRQRAAEVFGEE